MSEAVAGVREPQGLRRLRHLRAGPSQPLEASVRTKRLERPDLGIPRKIGTVAVGPYKLGESMAVMPRAAAEQLIPGKRDGALPGAPVRLGIRGFGSTEVPLPAEYPLCIPLATFAPHDVDLGCVHNWEFFEKCEVANKRFEKSGLGVRFYKADGTPWRPPFRPRSPAGFRPGRRRRPG